MYTSERTRSRRRKQAYDNYLDEIQAELTKIQRHCDSSKNCGSLDKYVSQSPPISHSGNSNEAEFPATTTSSDGASSGSDKDHEMHDIADSSTSEEETSTSETVRNFSSRLRSWASKHDISHRVLRELLIILRIHNHDDDDRPPSLPSPVYRYMNPAKKSVGKARCLDTQRKRFRFPVYSQIDAVKKPTSIDVQRHQSLHSLDDNEMNAGEEVPDCLDDQPDEYLDDSEIDIGEDMATSVKSTINNSRGISAQLQAMDATLRAMDATLRAMGHKVLNVQQDITQMSKSVRKTERNVDLILPHFQVSLPTELPAAFPIKDGEELRRMDQLVKSDSGVFEQIVKALISVGGNDTDDFMRRTMPRLMKNEFAKCCSVFGRQIDKLGLKDTVIFNSVFAAVKMNLATKECTEKVVEGSMRKWLANSRDRAGGSRYGRKKSEEGQDIPRH